jgi:microcystin-dependent protein
MKVHRKMNYLLISTALTGSALLGMSTAQACGIDAYLGTICITAATYCPGDTTLEANGQIMKISENQALYSLLGTAYGGNGSTEFALPDLRGALPIGVGQAPYVSSAGVLGKMEPSKKVTPAATTDTTAVTLPRQLGLRYCIVTQGIYPPRP